VLCLCFLNAIYIDSLLIWCLQIVGGVATTVCGVPNLMDQFVLFHVTLRKVKKISSHSLSYQQLHPNTYLSRKSPITGRTLERLIFGVAAIMDLQRRIAGQSLEAYLTGGGVVLLTAYF
jgi:hypothetical protein